MRMRIRTSKTFPVDRAFTPSNRQGAVFPATPGANARGDRWRPPAKPCGKIVPRPGRRPRRHLRTVRGSARPATGKGGRGTSGMAGPAVVLGQDLADLPGPVRDGAVRQRGMAVADPGGCRWAARPDPAWPPGFRWIARPEADERLPMAAASSGGSGRRCRHSAEPPACRAARLGGAQTDDGVEGEPVTVPRQRACARRAVGRSEPVPRGTRRPPVPRQVLATSRSLAR